MESASLELQKYNKTSPDCSQPQCRVYIYLGEKFNISFFRFCKDTWDVSFLSQKAISFEYKDNIKFFIFTLLCLSLPPISLYRNSIFLPPNYSCFSLFTLVHRCKSTLCLAWRYWFENKSIFLFFYIFSVLINSRRILILINKKRFQRFRTEFYEILYKYLRFNFL